MFVLYTQADGKKRFDYSFVIVQHTATHCNTLQHAQRTATHRYVFVLYKQADGKQQFEDSDKTPFVKNGRDKWSVTKFAEVFFFFFLLYM